MDMADRVKLIIDELLKQRAVDISKRGNPSYLAHYEQFRAMINTLVTAGTIDGAEYDPNDVMTVALEESNLKYSDVNLYTEFSDHVDDWVATWPVAAPA